MGSKSKKQKKQSAEAKRTNSGDDFAAEKRGQTITDPRFASVHSDPRFQRVPKRESKVTIDARFQRVFTDKRFASSSAALDKRGKRRKGRSSKDSLREYYQIEEEDEEQEEHKTKNKTDNVGESEESEDDSEREEPVRSGGQSSSSEESGEEEESDEEDSQEEGEVELTTDEEEEEETDEDDNEVDYEDEGPELVEEKIPEIEKETSRLAIVNLDWRHVSASDLYVLLSSFLPKDGKILSVSVYPSEFGLQRMKEEEIRGPVELLDDEKKKNDEDEDDEEDQDIIDQKLRAYEISRLRYYYAVVECDSSATADYLYKACDGVEFERSSNKLDLRFIPDSMEFKHPPRDVATEAPANYDGLDFHTRALQLSKLHLSWDEDEPHRVKTLRRKFKADQLAELELKEFLGSDESESDDDENDADKKEKKIEKYRALIQSGGNDGTDEDEQENDQDMEVTFNTGLEDLSKRILEKKDNKSETVWESYLRKRREKKKAGKNKANKHSSDDESSDEADEEPVNANDFFVEEPPAKRRKEGKHRQDKTEDEAEEVSRAELELLLADDKAEDGGAKGYNLKRKKAKVRKGEEEINEEKTPAAAFDDPRFSAIFTSPLFALDPTDPQFKRSASYARQVAQKKKGDQKDLAPKTQLESDEVERSTYEKVKSDVSVSKKEKLELSSAIRSVKMKMKQVVQPLGEAAEEKDKHRRSSLIQKVKKKSRSQFK